MNDRTIRVLTAQLRHAAILLILSLPLENPTFGEPTSSPANSQSPFSSSPHESVLLLGDHTVANTSGLTQRYFPALKHSANPVMRRTENWEGAGPYVWGNRMMQDEKTGAFRLWYIAFNYADNHYRWGYATSPDGITWNKPNLGVERYADAPAKNLLPLGPHPDKGARSIARDPRPETQPERRYLGVRFTYDGEFVSFSPDGIHWQEHPANPAWHVPSDIIHIMWDDRRRKFVAFYKVWEVVGREVRTNEPADGTPFTAHMPTFMPKDLGNGKTQFNGPCITFHPPGAAEVNEREFTLCSGQQGADDGGGTSLSGEWNAKRVQAFAESDDGLHWTNEQVILRADNEDPPTANIQYMFVMSYGGYYLGFLTMHDEAGYFRIQFAWSADGIQWHRPSREPWLDVGPADAFDCGMVLGPADPIIQQREMWFPYGGFPIRHDSKETDWQSAIGLATTRLDGFAAWQAGDEPGELVTQPFHLNGDRLFVNADANAGSVTVEVVNTNGKPFDGFDAASCRPITRDTLTNDDDGWIHWTSADLSRLKNELIQLKFNIQNARLYSFRVCDENTMKLHTPRATTH